MHSGRLDLAVRDNLVNEFTLLFEIRPTSNATSDPVGSLASFAVSCEQAKNEFHFVGRNAHDLGTAAHVTP
jgi:hypothetical protein